MRRRRYNREALAAYRYGNEEGALGQISPEELAGRIMENLDDIGEFEEGPGLAVGGVEGPVPLSCPSCFAVEVAIAQFQITDRFGRHVVLCQCGSCDGLPVDGSDCHTMPECGHDHVGATAFLQCQACGLRWQTVLHENCRGEVIAYEKQEPVRENRRRRRGGRR